VARRTFRINYRVTTRVRVRYRAEVRLTPMYSPPPVRISTPPPRQLTTSRTVATSSLYPIRQAVAEYETDDGDGVSDEQKQFDVFICHAGEDKLDVVRPLAIALRERELIPWFDEFELRIGDSLRRSIDHGLANSRFGIVVLSPSFLPRTGRTTS
jgi:TIR domain